MKAVRIHGYGGPEKFAFEDVPDPSVGPGDALVRIAATSVNPADYKMRSGIYSAFFPREMPTILGTDIAGVIEHIAPGTETDLKVGDRVFGMLSLATGGAYAEKVSAPVSLLVPMPNKMRFEDAAALPMIGLTGRQAIEQELRPTAGQTVLISGALGSVGRVALYFAKQAGARVIAGVRGSRLAQAAGLGADGVVALDDRNAIEEMAPFDAIVDVIGGSSAEGLVPLLRKGGVFVTINPPAPSLVEGIEIRSVQVRPDREALSDLAKRVEKGDLQVPIASVLPLEQMAEGHRRAEAGGSEGKIVIQAIAS